MANTYTVAPADVAEELPGMFPGGFNATSTPTSAKVQELIDEADTIVTLKIRDSVGTDPAASDRAAPIAIRFIENYVKAEVYRLAYAGRDPNVINALAQPYSDSATRLLDYIGAMGSQATGVGDPSPLISGHMTSRPLLLDSCDLDPNARGRF